MKLLLLAIFFSTSVFAQNYEAEARFGTFYETNTYYASDGKKSDVGFLIEPHLTYKGSGTYSVSTDSTVSYAKYMSNSNQDNLTYDLNLKNNLKLGDLQVYVTPKTKLLSEPALSSTEDRLERQIVGGDFGFAYAKDPRRSYLFEIQYEQESLSQSDYEFLDNQTIKGRLYYKKYFLPQTFVYFGALASIRQFPDGTETATSREKYDSQRIEPALGIEGRLTRHFKIRSYFGYGMIQYKEEVNFADPVYILELEEEVSPKDFLLMGLENSAEDSYFTNFQINQKVYMGYGRFIGDQILWVTKIDYVYRTYSKPQRRDDQRFVGETRMEYSYSEKLKIEASLLFDTLSSDAVDPDTAPIDPIASYQNIRFGFFGKYVW